MADSGSEPTSSKRCAGTRRAGGPCPNFPARGSDYCHFHDPAITPEVRKELARKGGLASVGVPRRRGKTPEELAEIIAEMLDGYLERFPNPDSQTIRDVCELVRTHTHLLDRIPEPEESAGKAWGRKTG